MSINQIYQLAQNGLENLTENELRELINAETAPDGTPSDLAIRAQEEWQNCYGSWGPTGAELAEEARRLRRGE